MGAGLGWAVLWLPGMCPAAGSQLSGRASHCMIDTEAGSLTPKSGASRAFFLPHSVGQIKSQGQPRFKGKENPFHLWMGGRGGTSRERKGCWQLSGDHLPQFTRWWHEHAVVKIHPMRLSQSTRLTVCELQQIAMEWLWPVRLLTFTLFSWGQDLKLREGKGSKGCTSKFIHSLKFSLVEFSFWNECKGWTTVWRPKGKWKLLVGSFIKVCFWRVTMYNLATRTNQSMCAVTALPSAGRGASCGLYLSPLSISWMWKPHSALENTDFGERLLGLNSATHCLCKLGEVE